jgi:hypothetical protein
MNVCVTMTAGQIVGAILAYFLASFISRALLAFFKALLPWRASSHANNGGDLRDFPSK